MFVLMKYRKSLKVGHVGSKTRSLGQILESKSGRLRVIMAILLYFVPEIKKKHCGKIKVQMMLRFRNITSMYLFPIMSSSDTMFETLFCVYPVCK